MNTQEALTRASARWRRHSLDSTAFGTVLSALLVALILLAASEAGPGVADAPRHLAMASCPCIR